MKKTTLMIIVLLAVMMGSSCKKDAAGNNSALEHQTGETAQEELSWVTLLPTSSFNSFSTYWGNFYPWGAIDHNGSARMRTQNMTTSGGVLTITAYPGTVSDKPSIHYFSYTCYAKQQVNVSASWPKWRVSGEFQCPSVRGTWPAFWLNGANQWPPESDIMEFKGSTTNWTNTYKNENGQWSSVGTTISGPANWHTYTAYLTRIGTTSNVSIEYWIDGTRVSTQTGQNFVNEPLNLIIDLQMEGSSGTPGPGGNTVMRARNVTIQRSATL
jgi:hypothetical protein